MSRLSAAGPAEGRHADAPGARALAEVETHQLTLSDVRKEMALLKSRSQGEGESGSASWAVTLTSGGPPLTTLSVPWAADGS